MKQKLQFDSVLELGDKTVRCVKNTENIERMNTKTPDLPFKAQIGDRPLLRQSTLLWPQWSTADHQEEPAKLPSAKACRLEASRAAAMAAKHELCGVLRLFVRKIVASNCWIMSFPAAHGTYQNTANAHGTSYKLWAIVVRFLGWFWATYLLSNLKRLFYTRVIEWMKFWWAVEVTLGLRLTDSADLGACQNSSFGLFSLLLPVQNLSEECRQQRLPKFGCSTTSRREGWAAVSDASLFHIWLRKHTQPTSCMEVLGL